MKLKELLEKAEGKLNFRFERKGQPEFVYYMVSNKASRVMVYQRERQLVGPSRYEHVFDVYDLWNLAIAEGDDWMFSSVEG